MKTLVRLLVSGVLVATALGCAADDPKQVESRTPGPASAPGRTDSKQAVSVTYTLSGGLKPADETLVYAADEPPPAGHTQADVRAVLEAASDPRLIKADLHPVPKDECCDRQTHRVTIVWDDGSSRTYDTLDGVHQPAAFESLLSQVA